MLVTLNDKDNALLSLDISGLNKLKEIIVNNFKLASLKLTDADSLEKF
ncbi:MAG: hypothetical protein LBV23_00510 [Deltaproteobacteria bacterium]|nr:hypothetical protein [Deltaproteobacteria bacterium]